MIKNTYKFIAIALMAVLMPMLAPDFAMASNGNAPQASVIGTSVIYKNSAAINYSYEPNGSDYSNVVSYIEYKNTDTDEVMISPTTGESGGSQTRSIAIYNLLPGTEYSYRAVVRYPEGITKSRSMTFKTLGGSTTSTGTYTTTTIESNSTTNTTNTNTNNTVTNNRTSTNNTIIDVPAVVSNVTTNAKNSVMTGGGTYKNGVGLSITNEQARTSVDDTFTYTVQYQNTNTASLQNAELSIELPEEYEFVKSSSDMEYDERDNTVSLYIGRVAKGAVQKVTFTARAIGDGSGEVRTTATLSYEGGSLSATDRDSFHGGSKSVLGASVFGAGFFPQTFVGWFLIILLIAAIIIIARRYMVAAPKPMVMVQQHPANTGQPQPQR